MTTLFGGYKSGPASKEAIQRALTDCRTNDGFVVFKTNTQKNQKTDRTERGDNNSLLGKKTDANPFPMQNPVINTPQISRQGSSGKRGFLEPSSSKSNLNKKDIILKKAALREVGKPVVASHRKHLNIGICTEKFSPLSGPIMLRDAPGFKSTAVIRSPPTKIKTESSSNQKQREKSLSQNKKKKSGLIVSVMPSPSSQMLARNIQAYRSAINGNNAPLSVLSHNLPKADNNDQSSVYRDTSINRRQMKVPIVTGILQKNFVPKGAINKSILRSQNLLKSQNLHNYMGKDVTNERKRQRGNRNSSASSFRSHSIHFDERRSIGSNEDELRSPTLLQKPEDSLQRELTETHQLISKLKVLTDATNNLPASRTTGREKQRQEMIPQDSGSDSVLERMYKDLIKRTNVLYREIYMD